jgi:cytochrome c oxidase subunit 2
MNFDVPLFPEQASTLAAEVDNLYFFALAVSAFFSLLIAVFIFIFFVKFRRRNADEVGQAVHGAMVLEVVWSIIPLAISMVMFGWGAKVFVDSFTVPEGATEYFATSKQWMWKFQHPEGHREINTLHVPVGELIKLTMTSEDVIHSFFVPAFRVKRDVLPGRYTNVWFEATKAGEYHLFCAEYCGTEHSKMIGTVVVLEPDDYQIWLSGATPGAAPAAAGAELFEQFACNTCHEGQGTGRGPSLFGIAGQEVSLAGGRKVERDDAYLRESILNPNARLVEGYRPLMPTFQGQINEEGVLQLIAYIKSLAPIED